MKEKLYTIPVNEAFDAGQECPLCQMKKKLELDAIDYTMGSSYMEDYIRLETDKIGFCSVHVPPLYANQNRLGLALILKTHMDKTVTDLEKLTKSGAKLSSSHFFKKKNSPNEVTDYINKLSSSCFVCNRVNEFFERYIVTIFYMYQNDSDFRTKIKNSKGFCTSHYGLLIDAAPIHLNGTMLDDFISTINQLYIENFKRVRDDLVWFIDKFDYRYVNEPWKNSKDALIRAMLKINSITEDQLS